MHQRFRWPAQKKRDNSTAPAPGPEEFHITGRKKVIEKYRPDSVEVTIQKQSSDLVRKYGITPPVLEKTLSFPRDNLENDSLPEHGANQTMEDWDAYFAPETEWRNYFRQQAGSDTVSIQRAPKPGENDTPYAIYDYERHDPLFDFSNDVYFEAAGPINVIWEQSPEYDLNTIIDDVFGDVGSYFIGGIIQFNRFAWNRQAEKFVKQQASVAGYPFGFLGRIHGRFWEFEGAISAAFHYDTAFPHTVKSFEPAEREAAETFKGDLPYTFETYTVNMDARYLGNPFTEPAYNNGFASVIGP